MAHHSPEQRRQRPLRNLETYPESDYAWVAALRMGQGEAAVGNRDAAHRIFVNASRRFAMNPLAVVLGHTYAARISEADGDAARALSDYQAALAGWDDDYGDRYSLYLPPHETDGQPDKSFEPRVITREYLEMRILDLKKTLSPN